MNEDRILEMFFEKARWQYAIDKGLFKDMNKVIWANDRLNGSAAI